MLRIFLDKIEEGDSHIDLTGEAADLTSGFEGGYLVSPVRASLEVTRTGSEILLRGHVAVEAVLECARCLDEFVIELESPIEVVCVIGSNPSDLAEIQGFIGVEAAADYIDLTDEIRDLLLVLIPLKPLCRADCLGLCPKCGTNLNKGSCSCSRDDHDSRWDALKRLI